MPLSVKFTLKDPQYKPGQKGANKKRISPSQQFETPIYMKFSFGYFELKPNMTKKYLPLKYSTGERIKPMYWNDSGNRPKKVAGFSDEDYERISFTLEKLERLAKDIFNQLARKHELVTPDMIRNELDIQFKNKTKKRSYSFLYDYVDDFISQTETGERLNDSKNRYSLGSIKNFKGFKSQLEKFQNEKNVRLRFENITIDFYNDFVQFFNKKKYSPNTIGRHIKNLKIFMRNSRDEGYHNCNDFEKKSFKSPQVEVVNVYLSTSELDAIYKLDLTDNPQQEVARDVFLIGCYTAQRFSDYSRINESMRTKVEGIEILKFTQQKTGVEVTIPISVKLRELLEKYDWNVPKIYEQKLNDRIKKVAKKAKIEEDILVDEVRGGLKVQKKVKKYEMIKTHTARRSGCTNMYLAGIPSIAIMKISGHKTEREFLKYIKVTNDESALTLANHPYFSDLHVV